MDWINCIGVGVMKAIFKISSLFALTLIMGLWTGSAQAATYWVSTTGGTASCTDIDGTSDPGVYKTPGALISAGCVKSSDTVIFKPGTYTTPISWSSFPQGIAGNPTQLRCAGTHTCVIQPNASVGDYGVITFIDRNYVRVEGFKVDAINAALAPLRARKMRLAVDDAGAGYSGLQQILCLKPDLIKLDRTLIQDIHRDPAKRSLAVALASFALATNSRIIAEGVETEAELEMLRAAGIENIQGYLLGRPMPLSDAAALLVGPSQQSPRCA